jgi:multidrug efflux pump subunit AcrA (membrane-fusion protein)
MNKLAMRGFGLATVLVLGVAASGLAADKAEKPEKSDAIPVGPCRVKLIDSVILASARTGVLAFVEPSEGDLVTSKQQVAGLMDEVARAQYEAAEKEASNDVEIRFAKKATEVARVEHEKAVEANKKSDPKFPVYPDIEVRRLLLAAERGALQIEQAEHQFIVNGLKRDEAREMLKTYRIEAPFDGVVTKVFKQKGEAAREGDPILELVSTNRVKVEGYVHIKDIWNVKQGSYVQVQLDVPEADLEVEKMAFEGRIVFVDVKVNPVTYEARVWAEVVNKDNVLRDGLQAKMTIFPNKRFTLPTSSQRSQ